MASEVEDDAAAVEYILVRVSTGWQWHDVSIDATATFGTSVAVYSSMLRGTALVPGRQELLHRRAAELRLPPHSTVGFQFQSVVLAVARHGCPSPSPVAVAVDGARQAERLQQRAPGLECRHLSRWSITG